MTTTEAVGAPPQDLEGDGQDAGAGSEELVDTTVLLSRASI
jgi:hypothetical protein